MDSLGFDCPGRSDWIGLDGNLEDVTSEISARSSGGNGWRSSLSSTLVWKMGITGQMALLYVSKSHDDPAFKKLWGSFIHRGLVPKCILSNSWFPQLSTLTSQTSNE